LELQSLDRGSPSLQQDQVQRTAQELLVVLSKACGDVPVELYIKETIESIDYIPKRTGGFANIHTGMLNKTVVAIKRLHSLSDDLQVRACVTGPSCCSDFLMRLVVAIKRLHVFSDALSVRACVTSPCCSDFLM
jgi:hypothetical protein